MSRQSESVLPGIIFIATIWAVVTYTQFQLSAYFIAIALWFIGMGAVRFVSRSHFRLGYKAWLLTLQVAVWFTLFLSFFPDDLPPKILILWGIAVPLVFVGAGVRWLHERFGEWWAKLEAAAAPAGFACVAVVTAICWIAGIGFWAALFKTLATGAMATIPLYYGWQFGQPLPRGERDARFGSEDAFRDAGMSDER